MGIVDLSNQVFGLERECTNHGTDNRYESQCPIELWLWAPPATCSELETTPMLTVV